MAFVACVMKQRPLKLVFCRNHGNAPQWSKWKLKNKTKSESNARAKSAIGNPLWNKEQVHFVGFDEIDKRQRIHARQARVNATVKHNFLALELEHNAWSANFLSGTTAKRIKSISNLKNKHWKFNNFITYSGRINRISLSSSGTSMSVLRFVAISMNSRRFSVAQYKSNRNFQSANAAQMFCL